jgi:copper homeostasis protein (lipoprotein)
VQQFILTAIAIMLICISCNKKVKIATDNSSDKEYYLSDNSQNSLDWKGIYQGITPCADCEGIKTEIRLNLDNTFLLKTRYLGKEDTVFIQTGLFKWDKKGSKITLNENLNHQYLVGENVLFKLNLEGESITGNLSNNYKLPKIDYSDKVLETQWNLVELENLKIKNSKAHIILKGEHMKVIGNGGCNAFIGRIDLTEENSKLDITSISSTKMACDLAYNEASFFQALTDIRTFSIKEDTLSLSIDAIDFKIRFKANF